jgi:hypothetical protein
MSLSRVYFDGELVVAEASGSKGYRLAFRQANTHGVRPVELDTREVSELVRVLVDWLDMLGGDR